MDDKPVSREFLLKQLSEIFSRPKHAFREPIDTGGVIGQLMLYHNETAQTVADLASLVGFIIGYMFDMENHKK